MRRGFAGARMRASNDGGVGTRAEGGSEVGVFAVGNRVKAGESGHDLCVSAAGSH